MDAQLDAALDLMRRLPPRHVERHLVQMADLVPHLTEDLLSAVDQPLKSLVCKKTGREYLICDYNRDGDSYRSPWSNEYDPPLSDGAVPSNQLRKLEEAANNAFDTYRDLYYEGGASSVYMWDLDDGFASVILIKKASDSHATQATWDSIHVFEVVERPNRVAHYKLTSTVMLSLLHGKRDGDGQMDLSGSLTRQQEQDLPFDNDKSSHLANLGRMVEDMEFKLRDALKNVYFDKTRDIVNEVRSAQDLHEAKKQAAVQNELFAKLALRRGQ
ncbi:F-actin-capping protein subunit beta [Catenaria anguillulae PL171]|uniref:F-actin-capping protein subunit beta n=1 Tax=Catenaria anguillulae PL171 TaxID=765915 RepID=A0A1Y2H9F6_9FUNG|nr:F-actin-capping protein subunit beta [Catenaria anguillulae PL171]